MIVVAIAENSGLCRYLGQSDGIGDLLRNSCDTESLHDAK